MTSILIVTEKPDAALHVAEALDSKGRPKKVNVDGVPFYEFQKGQDRILVCSALGHLYAVAASRTDSRSQYPVWEFTWKPKHLVERGQDRQEWWIRSISKVSKNIDRFINSCDYDIEGSLIGYTILKYACGGAEKKAQRMKFSTLTAKELQNAYTNVSHELDFPLAYAGMCRHEVDWLYGINLSRALTQSALKASRRYSTLSTGRVQGPTLRFIVDREKEIQTHVPTPYWSVRTLVDVDGQVVEATYEIESFDVKSQAESVLKDCTGKTGTIVKLESRTYRLSPPTPFDLSSLQAEAYRHFHLTPRGSLRIAERLYLDQLISYPRTSSQKLPPSIGYVEIMKGLRSIETYRAMTSTLLSSTRLLPNEGKKEDPAHPAIYPTGMPPRTPLEPRAQKMFDLIVRRFLATFAESATRQIDKATIEVGNHLFYLQGTRTPKQGWIAFYGPYAKFEEVRLPPLREGQDVVIRELTIEEKYSQPPSRYNPGSLLKAMEDNEIGTKATRADIIDTLYKRGYIKDQRIVPTELANRVTEILTEYCPKVVDVTFTRELETQMAQIELGKQTREHVVRETIEYLKPIIEDLKAKEKEIGEELTSVIEGMWLASTLLDVPCPKCGSKLKVVRNPNTKKRFIGCTGKWEKRCDFALPLPQFGSLTLMEKKCPDCGFQMIQVRSRYRRPIVSCPSCFVKKSRTVSPDPAAKQRPLC